VAPALGWWSAAHAQSNPAEAAARAEAGPSTAARPSEAPIPSCLDESISSELGEQLRPRGVQKRRFLKQGQLSLSARGGLFASDLLSSSYAFGGQLSYFVTEDLAVDLAFDVSPMDLDLDKPLSEFFGDPRFDPGTGYIAMAGLMWSPIHAKLKVAGSIVHSDIYLIAGAGRIFHDSVQGISYNAGFALDMLATRWITLRFELRDVIAVQEAVAETRLTNNLLATFGVALWLPTPL
jgi:outer membrane beta-barrel protein